MLVFVLKTLSLGSLSSFRSVSITYLNDYCTNFDFKGIIKWVSLATVYSNTMYWPPFSGWGGIVNMISKLKV